MEKLLLIQTEVKYTKIKIINGKKLELLLTDITI